MNNKGFTIVELLASFVLSMVIVVIMFQLIINLKDLYQVSVLKSELQNRQSIMTNKIYTDLTNKKVTLINDCGLNCVGFAFDDGSATQLVADMDNGYLTYDNYTIKLDSTTYFGNSEVNTQVTGIDTGYNRLLSINIPIYNKLFKNENFGINIVYPYNGYEVASGEIDTENGYVSDGLIVRLDAINNTGNGHSSDINEWVDLSGNGNSATLYNNPIVSNNSVIFNGKTNYARIENTANLAFPYGTTWEIRVKVLSTLNAINSSTNTQKHYIEFFGNWQAGGGGMQYAYYDNDTTDHFISNLYINKAYMETSLLNMNSIQNINEFYTVTLTYDNGVEKLYINGQKNGEISVSGNIGISSVPIAIGGKPSVSGMDKYANIEVQNVLIYNRALTDDEVAQNYQIDNFRY